MSFWLVCGKFEQILFLSPKIPLVARAGVAKAGSNTAIFATALFLAAIAIKIYVCEARRVFI